MYSVSNGFNSRLGDHISIKNYTDLPGYCHGRFTMMFNWRPDYDKELQTSEYLGNIGRFHLVSRQQNLHWFFYVAPEIVPGNPAKLILNYGSPNKNEMVFLSGNYQDWMQKWYTIVVTAGNPTDFVDWRSPHDSGNFLVRFTIFDQKTGQLLVRKDTRYDDVLPDLTKLIDPLPINDPYTSQTDCFSIRTFNGGLSSLEENIEWNRISNIWISYGTMWDPLDPNLDRETWMIDQLDDRIGDAVAWCNFCFFAIEKKGEQYWISGSDPTLALSKHLDQTWQDHHEDSRLDWSKVCSYTIVPRYENRIKINQS